VDTPSFVPDGYEIVKRLGAGRSALVWLARDVAGDRLVALKLPREVVRVDHLLRTMFENECQITLNLDHRNVVRAFAGHPTGNGAYLALEYCAGGTLDQLLATNRRLPLERALRLVEGVAAGLEHTHTKGVLHRDVKPANVFLDGDGVAKLGDFGTGTFSVEVSGDRVGTAFYMAPEIFEGAMPSIQSDVYSLGVLAYEVFSGDRPFLGESYEALMVAHLTSLPRDLRHHRADLPRGIGSVVARAMSRDATRRFQSVRAFADAFRGASGQPVAPTLVDASTLVSDAGRAGRGRATAVTEPPPAKPPAARNPAASEPRRGGLFGWFRRRSR
jgi:eukaryotic-like serine/threonine-protein kinase